DTLVDGFVARYSNSEFAYLLSKEELEAVIKNDEDIKTGTLFDGQAKKVLDKLQDPGGQASYKRELERQAIQADADQLYAGMVNEVVQGRRKIVDLNLLLLKLEHDYVFNP